MAKSAYNYTLVEEYKQKISIAYLGLEFEGWPMIIASAMGVITGTVVLGQLLSFVVGGMNGFFIAFVPSFIVTYFLVKFSEDRDEEIGRTKFQKFYYGVIKKYNIVYDANGTIHYISRKKKGMKYIVY